MYASRYSGIGKLYHEMPVAAPHSLSPGSCPSRRSLQRVGSSLYKVLKLTVSQIVNKLYTFRETQIFITMQKKNNSHWPLWPDHSTSSNLISLWSILISSSLYAKVCQVVSLYRYYDHFKRIWFPVRATCPAYFSHLYYINAIIFGDNKSWTSVSWFLVHAPVIASILVPTKTRY